MGEAAAGPGEVLCPLAGALRACAVLLPASRHGCRMGEVANCQTSKKALIVCILAVDSGMRLCLVYSCSVYILTQTICPILHDDDDIYIYIYIGMRVNIHIYIYIDECFSWCIDI